MSVRWSSGVRPAVICSGDMEAGVPTNSPVIVMPGCSGTRANPKSLMRRRPLRDRSRFDGLMSWWIPPLSCACSSASATSATIRATVSKYPAPQPSEEEPRSGDPASRRPPRTNGAVSSNSGDGGSTAWGAGLHPPAKPGSPQALVE